MDLQVIGHFLWPRALEFILLFFMTAYLHDFGIFSWLRTCECLAFFCERGPASFWSFVVPLTFPHFAIFHDHRPVIFCHFFVTTDLRVLVIFLVCLTNFQNCWPMRLWVFGHFLWPRTLEIWCFFHDLGPASFWHFFMTTDLRVLVIFPVSLTIFQNGWPLHFWHFYDRGPAIFWAFFVTVDLWVF